MKIYLYSENCVRKGQVFAGTDNEAEECGDVFQWGEGSEQELIAQAIDRLGVSYDKRPGGGEDLFPWKCARTVLAYLAGPTVEFDEERGVYVLEEPEEVED